MLSTKVRNKITLSIAKHVSEKDNAVSLQLSKLQAIRKCVDHLHFSSPALNAREVEEIAREVVFTIANTVIN